MLERLEAVEHQETALLSDQPGERSSLLGGVDQAWTGMAEVGERLLEEKLGGGVPLLVASLTIEGMDENPAGATVTVIAHLGEPLHYDARLTRSAFGVEDEDADAFVPGLIEGGELSLAAGEAFAVGAQDLQAVGLGGDGHGVSHERFETFFFELSWSLFYDGTLRVSGKPGPTGRQSRAQG